MDDSSSQTSTDIMNRRFRFMLISRAARSTALIFVTLSAPLYLLLLNFNIVSIGIIYLFVSLSTVAISVGIGMLGDRIGFRKAMMIGEIPALFITSVLAFTTDTQLILAGIILSGAAGSAGAMRGAMSPGINAYIASNWPEDEERVHKMALITSVASVFSIVGSLMLYSHVFLGHTFGSIDAFRILYAISFALIVVSVLTLSMLREKPIRKKETRVMNKASGKHVLKVAISNGVNGTGIGLAIVLLPAWFELRYGITPSQVGLAFLGSYVGSALGGFLASRYMSSEREGVLRVAYVTRIVQGLVVLLVAISPFVWLAVLFYSIRTFIAGFGIPNRNAINVSGIQTGDYGAGTSIQGVSARASQGFSGLSGYLMDVSLPFPLLLGGAIQAFSGVLYYKLMKEK